MSEGKIRLTEVDLRLLIKLSQLPAMSTREIYKIFYGDKAEKHAYRRLGQLVRNGYLLRYPYMGPLFGNKISENRKTTSLYTLSARGALVANASKAPRAYEQHHWLYYSSSVLFADLVTRGVIMPDAWHCSKYVKSTSTKFRVWEPFHALVLLPRAKYYLYFLQKPLKKKFAGTLIRFGKDLQNRFRFESNGSARRYYFVISPIEDYRNNLNHLLSDPALRMHIVTYKKAGSIISALCKKPDYYLDELIEKAALPGLYYGNAMDHFKRYSYRNDKKIYVEEFASGAVSAAYKIATYKSKIPVAMLTWREMKCMFQAFQNIEVHEIE